MENKKINLIKPPIFISIVILILVLYKYSGFIIGRFETEKTTDPKNQKITTTVDVKEPTLDLTQWKEYNNSDYRFIVKIPPLLLTRQLEKQTDYLLFVKFEENRYSKDKGVALGVTNRSKEEEVKKVKEEINQIVKVEPKENKIKISNFDATRLDYGKVEGFEQKSILVVANEKIAISISTTPDQIEKIISSFKFY